MLDMDDMVAVAGIDLDRDVEVDGCIDENGRSQFTPKFERLMPQRPYRHPIAQPESDGSKMNRHEGARREGRVHWKS